MTSLAKVPAPMELASLYVCEPTLIHATSTWKRSCVLHFTCSSVEVRLAAPELVSPMVCFPTHDFCGGLAEIFHGAGEMILIYFGTALK